MTNEPKAMREIHEIRLRNYEVEKALAPIELEAKRKADTLQAQQTIERYGLKIKAVV